MQHRIVIADYGKNSPEFIGRVQATATVATDGSVTVNVSLSDGHQRKDRLDWPAGTIAPDPTLRGSMRYQYTYPSGRAYPGTVRTVREAAQEAIRYAADIMARDTKAMWS